MILVGLRQRPESPTGRIFIKIAAATAVSGVFIVVLFSPLFLAHGPLGFLTTAEHIHGSTGFGIIIRHLVTTIYAQWVIDIPTGVQFGIGAAIVIGVLSDRSAALLAGATIIGLLPALFLIGAEMPSPRIWQFLLPVVAMFSGVGVSALIRFGKSLKSRSAIEAVMALVVVISTLFTAWSLVRSGSVIDRVEGRISKAKIDATQELARQLRKGDLIVGETFIEPAFHYQLGRNLEKRSLRISRKLNGGLGRICGIAEPCPSIEFGERIFLGRLKEDWIDEITKAGLGGHLIDGNTSENRGVPISGPGSLLSPIRRIAR